MTTTIWAYPYGWHVEDSYKKRTGWNNQSQTIADNMVTTFL